MKKIAIYCVSYNSYDEAHTYLASLDNIVKNADVELTVFVADNTEVNVKPIDFNPQYYKLHIFKCNNVGYFGAINTMMSQCSPCDYDYAIISNVDLCIKADFFNKLCSITINNNIGWLAPTIFSKQEQRDKNPKILMRYSAKKLSILKVLFKYHWLYNLYTHSAYKRKKYTQHPAMEIYAGHGSFIILTKEYFKRCGIIDYPVFLFCEEIYLGEQCRLHELKVAYEPSLSVEDDEHVSTGSFKGKQYCHYNYKALKYILNKYYSK